MPTGTSTGTKTRTTARAVVIGMQIRTMMNRLTDYGSEYAEEVAKCAQEKMFSRLTFCAMEGDDCVAKVVVEVDWSHHEYRITSGEGTVNVGPDTVLIETDEAIRGMMEYVSGRKCKMRVYFHPTEGNYDELCRRLRLRPSKMPSIKGKTVSLRSRPVELDEISYHLEMRE